MRLSFQVYATKQEATNYGDYPSSVAFSVLVLDVSQPDKLVERVARALAESYGSKMDDLTQFGRDKWYLKHARAVLSALGLPARKGGGGK